MSAWMFHRAWSFKEKWLQVGSQFYLRKSIRQRDKKTSIAMNNWFRNEKNRSFFFENILCFAEELILPFFLKKIVLFRRFRCSFFSIPIFFLALLPSVRYRNKSLSMLADVRIIIYKNILKNSIRQLVLRRKYAFHFRDDKKISINFMFPACILKMWWYIKRRW